MLICLLCTFATTPTLEAAPNWKVQSILAKQAYCSSIELKVQEGGLLVLWLTNREKLHRFVETELLPKWQLQPLATWYWLKCRADGELISNMVSTSVLLLRILRSYKPC